MEFIIGIVLFIVCWSIYSFGGSMLILSAFSGIPNLKKFKLSGIIKKEAPNKYILPIIIWLIILSLVTFLLIKFLPSYFWYIVIGSFIGLLNSCRSLSNKFKENNISELLASYQYYWTDKFIEETNRNGVEK